MLFELGRYDEAVEAYLAAANRYQDSPWMLDSYVQLARSYQRLGRDDDARRALERAKTALAKHPDDDQIRRHHDLQAKHNGPSCSTNWQKEKGWVERKGSGRVKNVKRGS